MITQGEKPHQLGTSSEIPDKDKGQRILWKTGLTALIPLLRRLYRWEGLAFPFPGMQIARQAP
jgi:hypothetical protein